MRLSGYRLVKRTVELAIDLNRTDFMEFDSMINLRPAVGNRTRGVDDPAVQARIVAVVDRMVTP